LFELTYSVMTDSLFVPPADAVAVLDEDYLRSGEKSPPAFLQHATTVTATKRGVANKRQKQYL